MYPPTVPVSWRDQEGDPRVVLHARNTPVCSYGAFGRRRVWEVCGWIILGTHPWKIPWPGLVLRKGTCLGDMGSPLPRAPEFVCRSFSSVLAKGGFLAFLSILLSSIGRATQRRAGMRKPRFWCKLHVNGGWLLPRANSKGLRRNSQPMMLNQLCTVLRASSLRCLGR